MQRNALLLVAALGMTGCAATTNDAGVCLGLRGDVSALRTALLAHPETPEAVGQAGTDVVIGFRAGCGK